LSITTRHSEQSIKVTLQQKMLGGIISTHVNHGKHGEEPSKHTRTQQCASERTVHYPLLSGLIRAILEESKERFSPMQLTSKDGNMVVDFYPVKFADGTIHNRLMLKVVTFVGATQSKRYINKKDMAYEIDSRVEGYGYQITDDSMIPQLLNSAMAMAC
tara:strand:+ start:236 stop:712 length:477 start_codon:yes stop_codon:yes gene_type:complete